MLRRKGWLLLLALLVLLVSCAQPDPAGQSELDPTNPVTITLWHYYVGENQQALESAVAEFNQSVGIEKGVIIEAVAKGSISELETAVTNSAMEVINSEPMPDIFSSYSDKAMDIAALDKLCDLNAYFSEEEKADYVEGFLADGIFDDRFLLVPIVKSTELTYINKTGWDAFAQANSYTQDDLTSWEGIYAISRTYTQWLASLGEEASGYPRCLMGFDSLANFIIIGCRQQGVKVIDTETQSALLDQAVLKRVFENYYCGFSLRYYDAVGKFRSDDIKAGDLVAYVGSSSSAAYFPTWIEKNNTQEPIEFLALSYPVFEGGEQYAIQQGAGMCVSKSTPAEQEGAALFLKWFTDTEQNIQFAMTTGYLPVKSATYQSDTFTAALDRLRAGDQAMSNVADVYEIALYQITEANAYAAKPFTGSYSVRSILNTSLLDLAQSGREQALVLAEQGLSDEEILRQLDVDARFAQWLETVRTQLTEAGIAYTDR